MADNVCVNPILPCAMTGACAALCGFEGLSVIIHGSSGCYYFTRTILKSQIYSTFLIESEIVHGTVDRLSEVVKDLSKIKRPIAVVNTCIPALIGDDLKSAFGDNQDVILVDSPGFIGDADAGYKKAISALNVKETERCGVNIDGISLLDLFCTGNLRECERVLNEMGVPAAVRFSMDTYDNLKSGASRYTISASGDFKSNTGRLLGSFMFPDFCKTVSDIGDVFSKADTDKVLKEWETAEEKIYYYCDKFLRKYNPPDAAVFSNVYYSRFAKEMLEKYLGCEVSVLSREDCCDLEKIGDFINDANPDLILGSTFESNLKKDAAFCGITMPDRSRISISAKTISGVEGGLSFIENVLNASVTREQKK